MVSCCAMGPAQSSDAIVLRCRAYGESDKIVTFLTQDAGKLTGIAKGAKNSRRRFANCLDPFCKVRVHFRARTGATMVFMDSCDLLEPAGRLSDPSKFAYGSYLIELVDQLTAEGQPVSDLFGLLAEALDELGRSPATAAFLRAFELRLLHCAGYGPQLQNCERCSRAIKVTERAFLDPIQGSIVCATCGGRETGSIAIAGGTLAALDALRTAPLAQRMHQHFTRPMATEASQLMGRLLALHLPRPLRSVKLIAALAP
jgi:DNA repair protein RecO (recombination protein O)